MKLIPDCIISEATTMIGDAISALVALERQWQVQPGALIVRGLFRPRLTLTAANEAPLGEIQGPAVLGAMPHRARCQVGAKELTLAVSGLAANTSQLTDGATVLVAFNKQIFSPLYRIRDWNGTEYGVRQEGRGLDRYFHLIDSGAEVTRLQLAPRRRGFAVTCWTPTDLPAGASAGIALLLAYHWFLIARLPMTTGGAGGG